MHAVQEDKDKITISSHAGTYHFINMAFFLMNAPATFQQALKIIHNVFTHRFYLVYLYDVIIISMSNYQHLKDI